MTTTGHERGISARIAGVPRVVIASISGECILLLLRLLLLAAVALELVYELCLHVVQFIYLQQAKADVIVRL
jgi:hypothetical protein